MLWLKRLKVFLVNKLMILGGILVILGIALVSLLITFVLELLESFMGEDDD